VRCTAWRSFLAMLFMVGLLFATGTTSSWVGPIAAVAAGTLAALVLPLALAPRMDGQHHRSTRS
jgi:hypothetical protein